MYRLNTAAFFLHPPEKIACYVLTKKRKRNICMFKWTLCYVQYNFHVLIKGKMKIFCSSLNQMKPKLIKEFTIIAIINESNWKSGGKRQFQGPSIIICMLLHVYHMRLDPDCLSDGRLTEQLKNSWTRKPPHTYLGLESVPIRSKYNHHPESELKIKTWYLPVQEVISTSAIHGGTHHFNSLYQ